MDGKRMAVAHTEGGGISVWDAFAMKKLWEKPTDPLPLMAGISDDGRRAWISSFATGRFTAYDVDTQEVLADFTVGKNPVQSNPSPDGRFIVVPLSGDGAAAILDATTFELLAKLPSGPGAHGVYYGPKQGGGWYAYVSNKFVPWITVIDLEILEVAGYIPLPKSSLGGQGILTVY
jgi:DNA-binding beta-propeller fold protein YncE